MPMSEAELAAAQGLADAEVAISDDNFGGEAVQAKAHDSKFNLAEEEEGAPAPAAEPLANPRDIAAQRLAAAEAGGPMARPATPSKKPGEGCDMEACQSAADRAREFAAQCEEQTAFISDKYGFRAGSCALAPAPSAVTQWRSRHASAAPR